MAQRLVEDDAAGFTNGGRRRVVTGSSVIRVVRAPAVQVDAERVLGVGGRRREQGHRRHVVRTERANAVDAIEETLILRRRFPLALSRGTVALVGTRVDRARRR